MKASGIVAFIAASIIAICLTTSLNVQADATTSSVSSEKIIMRDMKTAQIFKDMCLDFNLGNTFNAYGDWIKG